VDESEMVELTHSCCAASDTCAGHAPRD